MNDLCSVDLVDVLGSCKTIVNVARVSFDNATFESYQEAANLSYPQIGDRDKRLIRYLWKHRHTTPFRHNYFTFEIQAPIFVLRQWMKHQIGCSWNEASGRYIKFENKWYRPNQWRMQADNVKQGSGGPFPKDVQEEILEIYDAACKDSFYRYNQLLEIGLSKEQARMCLPLSLITKAAWTPSLHALLHFLRLRLDLHAQAEIREFAIEVRRLIRNTKDFAFILDFVLDNGFDFE